MISSPAASAPAPTYAQVMQARQTAQAAKAEEKRAVAENVAEAMSSARMDAPEQAKRDAKAKVMEIAKRLQTLRKLFAGDPKEMARALAHVMKELRAAVKAYKAAGGDELGFASEAAKAAVANDAPKANESVQDERAENTDAAQAETADSDGAEAQQDPAQDDAQPTAAQGAAIYDAVVGKVRKSIGEDGLDFVKMIRELIDGALGIRNMLEGARTQYRARKPDQETDKQFEAADKEMKALSRDLDDMARDIRNAVPDAGMKLSMDA